MSAHADGLIEEYTGRTDLRSGALYTLRRTLEEGSTTEEQRARISRILQENRDVKLTSRGSGADQNRAKHDEKMQELADREEGIQRRELTALLNTHLTKAGATDDRDLEEARAMLERNLNGDRNPLVIDERVEQLRARFPQLFSGPVRETPAAREEPTDKTKRTVPKGAPGANGLAAAKRRGFVTD